METVSCFRASEARVWLVTDQMVLISLGVKILGALGNTGSLVLQEEEIPAKTLFEMTRHQIPTVLETHLPSSHFQFIYFLLIGGCQCFQGSRISIQIK